MQDKVPLSVKAELGPDALSSVTQTVTWELLCGDPGITLSDFLS